MVIGNLACFLAGLLLIGGFAIGRSDACAGMAAEANDRVEEFHVGAATAHDALRDIARRANVVIGVEGVQPEKESRIDFDFPGGTVAELLDGFVSQSPDYRWEEVRPGIIHVSRKGAHVSLTDVVVSYPGAHNKNRREMWLELAMRPEVSAWMRSSNCRRGDIFHAKQFQGYRGLISIPSGSVTVAQLLDEVAQQSGVNYWAVLQSPLTDRSCNVFVLVW